MTQLSKQDAIKEVRFVADGIKNMLGGDSTARIWIRRLLHAAKALDASHRKPEQQHDCARIRRDRRVTGFRTEEKKG